MRLCKRLNPFNWARKTIIIVTFLFLALGVPAYLLGFSAFATTVNPTDAILKIPTISLSSGVSPAVIEGNILETPEHHVASYTNGHKIFLYGHSITVFKNLHLLKLSSQLSYTKAGIKYEYQVEKIETLPVEDILMSKITKNTANKTLILMTCAGQKQNGQYPERLIIYTKLISEQAI